LIPLKYIKIFKVLRHISILIDHHQGKCLYLAKVTEYLKNLKTLNLKSRRSIPVLWQQYM